MAWATLIDPAERPEPLSAAQLGVEIGRPVSRVLEDA